MESVERYNRLLKAAEATAIKLLNSVLDKGFKRLAKRTRQHLLYPEKRDIVNRNLLVLQEFNTLIPAVNPNRADIYDTIFYRLLDTSAGYGYDIAKLLTTDFSDRQINVAIPIEAVTAGAKTAHGYLRKHGQKFAETSTEIVMQGMAEGRPTDKIIQDMRRRLGVTKARAAMIVRTESLRAYNEASNNYYAQMGIEEVSWYATSDDRVCPWCAPRAGQIYKRTEVTAPIHPQCRCYLAPYLPELAAIDKTHREAPAKHREEVRKELELSRIPSLNKPASFEQIVPQPIRS